jgi:DNA invertase Pin-like site-specific DNA recombinase
MIAIYTRVSAEKQEKKYSPAAQRQTAITFAKSQGQEYALYEETGSWVEILMRPQLGRLLSDIETGTVSAIWCIEQSRLSRSVEDGAYLRKVFLAHNVRLNIDGVETDLSNLTSKLSYNIGNAISEYERDRISERLSRGSKVWQDTGRRVQNRMFGHTYSWQDGKRVWKIEPDQAKVVRNLYDGLLAGKSIQTLVRELNDPKILLGMKPAAHHQYVWKVLPRPEYCGVSHNSEGELIPSRSIPQLLCKGLIFINPLSGSRWH